MRRFSDVVILVTLEDRPDAAISLHVAVGLLAALTVLAESRDDATGVVVIAANAIVQTVGKTVSGDVTAEAVVCEPSADVVQRLLDTCKRRVVGLFHGGQRRVEAVV